MENKKISVVVPVYNVEDYIENNIKSLLNQTYKNFEIIYIDDGSTDNSLNILNMFKKIDSRIKVIHQQNSGVSHSRNVGIEYSNGEYITFIDADDFVDNDYLEYLLNLISKNHSDMAISISHHKNYDNSQFEELYEESKKSIDIIDDIYMNRIFMAVWNKIYSKRLLDNNDIRFDETLWYAEGMHFNIQCLSCLKKIEVGNKKIYHYISNPESALRKGFNIKNEKCALKSLELQRNILKEHGINNCKSLEFHYMMVSYMILTGIKKDNQLIDNYKEEFNVSIRNIKERKFIPIQTKLSIRQKIRWILIGFFPVYMVNRDLKKCF